MEIAIWLSWASLALASFGDVWTTNKALSKPGLREKHPLWARIQAWQGGSWWVIRYLGAGIVGGLLWLGFQDARAIAGLSAGVWAVVAWNLWKIKRA